VSGADPSVDASRPEPADQLRRVLSEIQRRGGIGRTTIEEAVAHADQYVAALPDDLRGGRLVDLGSGGGLPGLVIVARRPDLIVTLVERRDKRADLLRFGVRGLDAGDRVRVVAADVDAVIRREPGAFDIVTARSFGPLTDVVRVAAALLRAGGCLIVSEPPEGGLRITAAALAEAGMVDDGRVVGSVGAVHRWRHSPVSN
jgi:16S rRNA (guanine527-N7)-methyltransferase